MVAVIATLTLGLVLILSSGYIYGTIKSNTAIELERLENIRLQERVLVQQKLLAETKKYFEKNRNQ